MRRKSTDVSVTCQRAVTALEPLREAGFRIRSKYEISERMKTLCGKS